MQLIEIPKECYEHSEGFQQIREEANISVKIKGYLLEGRHQVLIENALFPYDTIIKTDTLWTVNQMKSIFIESIKLVTQPFILPGFILTVATKKGRQKLIDSFNWLGHRIMSPIILKDKHLTQFTEEFIYVVFEFLRHLVNEESAYKLSKIVCHMFEYDEMYRIMAKDLLTSTTKERLMNISEIKTLTDMLVERNNKEPWTIKFKKFSLLLRVALHIPVIKRAYLSAIHAMTIENMQLSEGDYYWSVYKLHYNHQGMNLEQKKAYAQSKGWTYPDSLI